MRQKRWIRIALAAAIGGLACAFGGALTARNFPLDDAYIHLSYGLDFKLSELFSFDGQQRDAGTSSWLWTALCILVVRLKLPAYPSLLLVSLAIFCGLLHGVMELVARALPRELPLRSLWPLAAALLVAANGNVIWLSLTGMETSLSVLLLLLTVSRMLSGRGMTWGAGALALLLVWTRIEGVIWLGLAAAAMPFVGPRAGPRAKRGWLLPLAGLGLYLGYNLTVGGHLLPTSAVSKRATFVAGGHDWKGEAAFLTALTRGYLRPHLPGWLIEVAAAALSFVALLAIRARRGLRRRIEPAVAAVAVLLGGAFVHALANVVEFRSSYHHLRYFAPIVFLVPALSLPLFLRALHALARRAGGLFSAPLMLGLARLTPALVALPIFATALALDLRRASFWASLYVRNAEQLAAVHLDVASYLRDLPGARRVATFDIGALRWASGLKIADLAGTSDAVALRYQMARKQASFVADSHADLYISVENGFDFIATRQPTYSLEHLRTWQFPEYYDPFPPHSKRMVLYRVNHCGEPRLVREIVGMALLFDKAPENERMRAAVGVAEGEAFARWPVSQRELGRPIRLAHGSFLSSDGGPLRDKAVGRFETVAMRAEGDFLSFRMAGGNDARRLRIELRSEGKVLATWTGFNADAFLEIIHPLEKLRGKDFTLALIDQAKGGWGHLMLDEVQQFSWREVAPQPCPNLDRGAPRGSLPVEPPPL